MADWLDDAKVLVENQGNRMYLQVDGHDIVSITDIDRETGTALVTVHKSTHPDADAAWQGQVNIKERGDDEESRPCGCPEDYHLADCPLRFPGSDE